jgi:hypothetical protein
MTIPENPLNTERTIINPAVPTITPMIEIRDMMLAALPFLLEKRYRRAMKREVFMFESFPRANNQTRAG